MDERPSASAGEWTYSGIEAMKIPVRLLNSHARIPQRAHKGDAGADLYAAEEAVIAPAGRADVGTGIALSLPEGYAGFVQARSGLAFRHGLMVVNAPGLIDSGYRGEIRVCLYNSGTEPFSVRPGDRIAQLVIQAVVAADYEKTESLTGSPRGTGGFGSTG